MAEEFDQKLQELLDDTDKIGQAQYERWLAEQEALNAEQVMEPVELASEAPNYFSYNDEVSQVFQEQYSQLTPDQQGILVDYVEGMNEHYGVDIDNADLSNHSQFLWNALVGDRPQEDLDPDTVAVYGALETVFEKMKIVEPNMEVSVGQNNESGLESSDFVQQGNSLTEYEIQAGDSLTKIAEAHYPHLNDDEIAQKVDEIAALNGIEDKDRIFAGQTLKLEEQAPIVDTANLAAFEEDVSTVRQDVSVEEANVAESTVEGEVETSNEQDVEAQTLDAFQPYEPEADTIEIKEFDQAEDVAGVQAYLNMRFDDLSVDGMFGNQTGLALEGELKNFQENAGLEVNGEYTDATRSAILEKASELSEDSPQRDAMERFVESMDGLRDNVLDNGNSALDTIYHPNSQSEPEWMQDRPAADSTYSMSPNL